MLLDECIGFFFKYRHTTQVTPYDNIWFLSVKNYKNFAMPETWLGLVNRSVYYGRQTRKIYQLLPYSMDFKGSNDLLNPLTMIVLSKCSMCLE